MQKYWGTEKLINSDGQDKMKNVFPHFDTNGSCVMTGGNNLCVFLNGENFISSVIEISFILT